MRWRMNLQYPKAMGLGLLSIGLFFFPSSVKAQLPEPVRVQLSVALDNWNASYGARVLAVDLDYRGTVQNEEQRGTVIREILENNDWFPLGDPSDPDRVSVNRFSILIEQLPEGERQLVLEQLPDWMALVNAQVQIGDHIISILWESSEHGSFSTTCIANDQELKLDTIISNTWLALGAGGSANDRVCHSWEYLWIWGSHRGSTYAEVKPVCGPDGLLIDCDFVCNAKYRPS